MKKILFLLTVLLFINSYVANAKESPVEVTFNLDKAKDGVITLNVKYDEKKIYKVGAFVINRNNYNEITPHFVPSSGKFDYLVEKQGEYFFVVTYKEKQGVQWKKVGETIFTFDNKDAKQFLNHTFQAPKTENTEKLRKQLFANKKTLNEKIKAYESYLKKHYKYDKTLHNKNGYILKIDKFIERKKGFCYDYAALTSSLFRAEGIETRMVIGELKYNKLAHAWTEFKIDDKWVAYDFNALMQGELSEAKVKDKELEEYYGGAYHSYE